MLGKLNVTTSQLGLKSFMDLENTIIKDEEGEVIGEALALFFLINIEKRRPTRIQKEQYEFYGDRWRYGL